MKFYHTNRKAILIFYFFVFVSLNVAGQEHQNHNNPSSREDSQSKFISGKHIQAKGTNLFIVPPDSFIMAVTFPGFIAMSGEANMLIRKGQSSFLNTVEIYSSPQTLNRKINSASWKSEKMKIGKREAFFVSSENSDSNINSKVEWILVCENNQGCFILEGNYPSSSAIKYSEKIKNSILSIIIQ